jgi:pyruvate kinase
MRRQRKAKILATLGPASSTREQISALFKAGADVFRLNFSHGTHPDHQKRYDLIREIEQEYKRPIGILMDLQGPKLRVGTFPGGSVELKTGGTFRLDLNDKPGDAARAQLPHPEIFEAVEIGTNLLLDDGRLRLRVKHSGTDFAECDILVGGKLSDRKGVNVPDVVLPLSPLTAKDREDLRFGLDLGVDWVAMSFVQRPEDVAELRKLIGGRAKVLAKLEKPAAIERLEEIIDLSDAVMVARGDLGVEIGDAELPGLQKKIIRTALEHNRVVITATQMLQSMVDNPIPTRAEVLDVANAVIDGTDAVMLSAETASGSYPVKSVEAMVRICLGAERQFDHDTDFEKAQRNLGHADQAIAMASMFLAEHIKVRAIIALTESGGTARHLSRFRSEAPIFGLSRHPGARRRMARMRDVFPIAFDSQGHSPRQAARGAIALLFELGQLSVGDRVVITSGDHMEHHGATNTLRLLQVGEGGTAEGLGEL